MKSIRLFIVFILLASILAACAPQTTATEITSPQALPTQTSIPSTATTTFTPLPTGTPLPSETPAPTLASCAVPLNPAENATVPAQGPFDFTWSPFAGAASYVVSIGPTGWYPTNFPVSGTTLTRYMENFPGSPAYEWSISAVNANGQELCKAGPYKFAMSTDLAATPSFSMSNEIQPTSENQNTSSNDHSSGTQQDGPGSDSPSTTSLDASFLIVADGDTEDCWLSVFYRVKIHHEFTSFKLIYAGPDGVEGSVDFTAPVLEPYPAYNTYNAITPPLPVHRGDTVSFGVSYTLDIGTSSHGMTLQHAMSNCNQ